MSLYKYVVNPELFSVTTLVVSSKLVNQSKTSSFVKTWTCSSLFPASTNHNPKIIGNNILIFIHGTLVTKKSNKHATKQIYEYQQKRTTLAYNFKYLAVSMLATDAIWKGVLMGLFMAISVGPTIFAIIRYSLDFSYKAGLAFVIGVSLSDAMYVVISNIAATWLHMLEPYHKLIAMGGAVAFMAIGLIGLLRKLKPKRPSSVQLTISGGDIMKIGLSGFLINTLNPGVLITWMGAVTITADKSGFYRFILFGTALAIILSIDFSKVFLADRIKKLLTVRKVIYLQRISAACLLAIGIALFIGTTLNIQKEDKSESNKVNEILSR